MFCGAKKVGRRTKVHEGTMWAGLTRDDPDAGDLLMINATCVGTAASTSIIHDKFHSQSWIHLEFSGRIGAQSQGAGEEERSTRNSQSI